MSHRFKSKRTPTTYAPKRTGKNEFQLRKMARLIKDQDQLNSIMAQTRPEMREAGFRRIQPFLSFPGMLLPALIEAETKTA